MQDLWALRGVRTWSVRVRCGRYGGAPWPQEQTKEVLGLPTGPGRNLVQVKGCPLTRGPTHGGIPGAHGPQEKF